MKILVVDDSMEIRDRFFSMLSGHPGIEALFEAENVLGAARAVKQLDPDIVILDIRLPFGSGMDILRFIRNLKSSCKVIVLTNYPYPQYREKCMALGADYFFEKSTEFEKAFKVVEQLAAPVAIET